MMRLARSGLTRHVRGMSSKSRKAGKVEVARDTRVRELTHIALASGIAQVCANHSAALADRDPEATHQLRVGVRRLRVVLKLFAKYLGATEVETLQTELRWVFQRLGAVRDYDVLIESASAQPPRAGAEALHQALVRARDSEGEQAVSALESERYDDLVRTLRKLAADLEADNAASPRARKWLKKRLDKRLEAVLARTHAITGEHDEALHELRKELKKLRYTADLTRGLWGPKRTVRYLRRLSKLQDVLGPINDAAVGRRLLASLAEQLDTEAAAAAGELGNALDERVERNLKSLPRAFEKLADARPFWQ